MKWIREHTHIVDHPRLLEAGSAGRDLWHWGMLYAGLHETDGELPLIAVLSSSWGTGGKRNIVVAQKLCDVGLWERTDTGYRICRWIEMGNPTQADLAEKRQEEREGRKVRRRRLSDVSAVSQPCLNESGTGSEGPQVEQGSTPKNTVVSDVVSEPCPPMCPPRTPHGVPYSYSYSESGSGSDLREPRSGPLPTMRVIPDPADPPPDWWPEALATVQMATSVALPASEAWVRYAGHRAVKTMPAERRDAVQWLTSVMVREAREARERARRQDDRDAKFDRDREKTRDAAAAPQPYHQVVKPPQSERRASPAEQAAAMKAISEMFKPGKTGS
jgi:hypothetical protein